MGVCSSTKQQRKKQFSKEQFSYHQEPPAQVQPDNKITDEQAVPIDYANSVLKPKSGSINSSRLMLRSRGGNTDGEGTSTTKQKQSDKKSPSFNINKIDQLNTRHERNITSPGLGRKRMTLLATDPGLGEKPLVKLSTDSFSFMKRNIEDFARKKPFPNLNLEDFDDQLLHSESMHKPDSVDFQQVWEGIENGDDNFSEGHVNISIIDAELKSLGLVECHSHQEKTPRNSIQIAPGLGRRPSTPGLKNDRALNRTQTPQINNSFSFIRENKDLVTLGSDMEILMIRKYTKLWHNLAFAYKSNENWYESLECLRPVLLLYMNLKLLDHVKICLGHIYFLGIMLCIDKKITSKQPSNYHNKLFEDLLRRAEEYVGDEWKHSELLVVLGIFYELSRGIIPENERLELFKKHLDHLKEQHHESDLYNKIEFDDMYILEQWYLEGPRRDRMHNHTKFLHFSSLRENPPLYIPNAEAKQDFRGFVQKLYTFFMDLSITKLNQTAEWNVPAKIKGLSFLLMKMGNLLRIWLELPLHALFFYNHSLRLDSTNAESFFYAGITYRSLKKHRLAAQCYLSALKKEPNYIDCLYNLGNLYLDEYSNMERAEECYRRAILAFEDLPRTVKPPRVNRGKILSVLSEINKFRRQTLKAILLNILGLQLEPLFAENYADLIAAINDIYPEGSAFEKYFSLLHELLNPDCQIEEDLGARFLNIQKYYNEICATPAENYETEVSSPLLSAPLGLQSITVSKIFSPPVEDFLNNPESNNETKFLKYVLINSVATNLKDLEEIFTATCFEERQFASVAEEELYRQISSEFRRILEL